MESKEALRDHSQTQVNSSQAAQTGVSESASSSTQAEPLAPPGSPVNPFAPDDGRYVTKEEYWAKWYENPYPDIDVSYEWNNGKLEAKPLPNEPQLDLYNWFLDLLRRFVSTYAIAKLINLETGFVLTIEDLEEPSGQREAVRKPDIGVILNSNPVSWGGVDQRHFEGVCDMVVEAVSDSTPAEVLRDTEEKRRDYALAGVKEYYILDPNGEHMRFYRLIAEGRYEEMQPDAEGVIGSDVLPGLQFRMEDMQQQPDLEELALDDVYSGYVIPKYQIAVTKSEAEAQRAEEEEQRADAEAAARRAAEQRAEEEAQRAGSGSCGAPSGGATSGRGSCGAPSGSCGAPGGGATNGRGSATSRCGSCGAPSGGATSGGGISRPPRSRRANTGDGRGVGPAAPAVLLNP